MTKQVIIATVVLIAIVGILRWSVHHDKLVQQSADRYETCVKAQYGVSPAAWYSEHGAYPECRIEISNQ